MAKKKNVAGCCEPIEGMGCCKVEALVSVDERGQMILPKEVRGKINLSAGDKLAVITWEKDGEVSFITLIPSQKLVGMVEDFMGPMMGGPLTK